MSAVIALRGQRGTVPRLATSLSSITGPYHTLSPRLFFRVGRKDKHSSDPQS